MVSRTFVIVLAAVGLVAGLMLVGMVGVAGAELPVEKAAADQEAANKAAAIEKKRRLDVARGLLVEGLEAEVAGEAALRGRKIAEALVLAPELAAAQFHSGHVRVDGKFLSVDAAIAKARQDEWLLQYVKLRGSTPDTLGGHRKLASWCLSVGLEGEAKAHSLRVLAEVPKDRAALKSLALRWHQGRLVTDEQAEQAEEAERRAEESLGQWVPVVTPLRYAILNGDSAERAAAQRKLRAINDPRALPALLEVLGRKNPSPGHDEKLLLELVQVLGNFRQPVATSRLVWFAVMSTSEPIRNAAIEKLRARDFQTYAPLLLADLMMPIELGVSTAVQPDGGFRNSYSLYQQRASGYDLHTTISTEFDGPLNPVNVPYDTGEIESYWDGCGSWHTRPVYRLGTLAVDTPELARERQVIGGNVQADRIGKTQAVAQYNQQIAQYNRRIFTVLEQTVGRRAAPDVKRWWAWWQEHLDEHPEQRVEVAPVIAAANAWLTPPLPDGLPRGTIVWTQTGRRAIEQIAVGDRVLSQDSRTGKLAFQVVLAVLSRDTRPMIRIARGEDHLRVAPGQLIWVAGDGWRRAAELPDDGLVHGISGSEPARQFDQPTPLPSYQLVVDQFHTLLIGTSGMLTHDATPARATGARVPGLGRK